MGLCGAMEIAQILFSLLFYSLETRCPELNKARHIHGSFATHAVII